MLAIPATRSAIVSCFELLSSASTKAKLSAATFTEAPVPSSLRSTASADPAEEGASPTEIPAWLKARIDAYGVVESQIEYITENGLDKWQEHVAKIKADNPKT